MTHSRKDSIEEKGADIAPHRLSDLPTALLIKNSLFSYLDTATAARLGRTSHRFRDLPEYEEATIEFNRNLRQHFPQLLLFVVHGNKDEAEKLITQYPELLFTEGKTSDYSSRKLQGTALQLALGAEDFNLHDKSGNLLGEGMVEMILRHLKKLPNGEAIIAEQIQKQFPDGWKEQEEEEHKRHLSALREVWNKINASANDRERPAAIWEFKKTMTPPEMIITSGRHWDAKLLQAAFEMGHNEHCGDDSKDGLFYREVIGYLQTLAPANYAMAKTQGLKDLLVDGKNFERDLSYRDATRHRLQSSYYPLHDWGWRESGGLLGSDFWLDCENGIKRWKVSHALTHQESFKTLLEQKQQHCDHLCHSQTLTQARTFRFR